MSLPDDPLLRETQLDCRIDFHNNFIIWNNRYYAAAIGFSLTDLMAADMA